MSFISSLQERHKSAHFTDEGAGAERGQCHAPATRLRRGGSGLSWVSPTLAGPSPPKGPRQRLGSQQTLSQVEGVGNRSHRNVQTLNHRPRWTLCDVHKVSMLWSHSVATGKLRITP